MDPYFCFLSCFLAELTIYFWFVRGKQPNANEA
jgi:hypothetical protein